MAPFDRNHWHPPTEIANYEDFYQFIIDSSQNTPLMVKLFEISENKLKRDYKGAYKSRIEIFEIPNYKQVIEVFNYLIWDLLHLNKSKGELLDLYKPFIELIKIFDEVDIFTLNHDLLLENIFEAGKLNYTKGFSIDNSDIRYNMEFLPTFNGDFECSNIRILKLHGSIDLFEFKHYQEEGSILIPLDNQTFFITNDFREKQGAVRVNPASGEILQHLNVDIIPKFITSKEKTKIIANSPMYSMLYKQFEETLIKSDNLLISGYSFRDEHVDKLIKSNRSTKIVNHNPFVKYPFQQASINVKTLEEAFGQFGN